MSASYNPVIRIVPNSESVDHYAAEMVISQIRTKPDSVISLPTGSTPENLYNLLVLAHKNDDLDFSKVTIFNLDEYWPISKNHPSSYAYYMRKHLVDHININSTNWYIPNGEAPDAQAESERFEAVLQQFTPDLTILGIGPGTTCHIGFNEKGSTIDSTTRYVALDPQTRSANSKFFQNPTDTPTGAITQGIADILRAKKILLIAKGEGKAWGIHRTINGEIGATAPSSYLRCHPAVTIMLDQAAAHLL